MSWNEIVETAMFGSGFFYAAVLLQKNGFLAASTVGYKVSKQDYKAIMECFTDTQKLYKHGLTVGDIKYVAITVTPRTIHCKIGPDGLLCVRAKNCLLVGLYRPPVMPQQAVNAIEIVADQINNGIYNVEVGS